MPDLLTHGASGLLLGWALAGRRPAPWVPLFALGNLLPDAMARVPAIVLGELDAKVVSLPDPLLYAFEPLHQPGGMLLAAAALAQLFRPGLRLRAGAVLYAGMLLHLGLDLLQFHEGAGHLLLFPFSDQPFEIGIIGSEDSVWVAVPLALVAGAVFAWRRRRLAAPSPRGEGTGA